MFIFWGRKITRKRLGYVADFCPICRCKQAFKLEAVRSSGHVYYVSLGGGQLVGYERTCEQCGTSFRANADLYANVSKELLPVDDLKLQTYPALDAAIKDQMALEARIKAGGKDLKPQERYTLIKAPFLYLSPKVERRFASTHIDLPAFLAILGAIAVLPIGAWVGHLLRITNPGPVLLFSFLIGVGLIVWQISAAGTRFMKAQILPTLATSLRPLKPTQEEVERVLEELRRVKQKIGRKVSASELLGRIEAMPL